LKARTHGSIIKRQQIKRKTPPAQEWYLLQGIRKETEKRKAGCDRKQTTKPREREEKGREIKSV